MVGEIYTLTHPETKRIFYVGSTVTGLVVRLSSHMSCVEKLDYGIYSFIREQKIKPIIECVEIVDCETKKDLIIKEREWVEKLIKQGCFLYNKVLNPSRKIIHNNCTIKVAEGVHKELKRYIADNQGERMEDVAGFAIMDFLKSRNHKFSPIKKVKIEKV